MISRGGARSKRSTTARPSRNMSSSELNRIVANKVNKLTKGESFKPNSTPIEFDTQPWNNAILRKLLTVNTKIEIRADDIYQVIWKQLGLYIEDKSQSTIKYTPIHLEWRIQSVSIWNLADSHGFIRLLPMSFTTSINPGYQELANPSCMAQKNMYACVGYKWPVDHQNYVMYSTPDKKFNPLIALIDTNDNSDIEIHWKVLWRCSGGAEISKVYTLTPLIKKPGRRKDFKIQEQIDKIIDMTVSEGKAMCKIAQYINNEIESKEIAIEMIASIIEHLEDDSEEVGSTASNDFIITTPRRSERLRSRLLSIADEHT